MLKLPIKMLAAVEQLKKLSGIGEKTAMRHVLSMAKWSESEIQQFSSSVLNLKLLQKCIDCGFFSDEKLCSVCLSQERRDRKIICVVENVLDVIAIEKTGQGIGLYHVLGGVLNPLLNISPDALNISKLLSRIDEQKIEEIILALNPSVEGDLTSSYLRELIPSSVKVERIGFGVPVGGNLEYLDSLTILKSFENRKAF